MTLVEWIAPYLMLPTVLVPALKPQPKEGWSGETVLVKKSGTPYWRDPTPSGADPNSAAGTLRGIEYRVLKDKDGKLHLNELGSTVLVKKEDMVLLADAVAYFTSEIEREPTDTRAHSFRGWAYFRRGKGEEALKDMGEAIRLAPNVSDWRNNRGIIHSSLKQFDKAVADFDEALRLSPNNGLAMRNRAFANAQRKEYDKALADYRRAIEIGPRSDVSLNGLAWLLATCPDAKFRDGKQALEAAKKACELTKHQNPSYLDTLAAAHAESGDFAEAVKWQEKALEVGEFPKGELEEAKQRLQLYKDKKPYRLPEK